MHIAISPQIEPFCLYYAALQKPAEETFFCNAHRPEILTQSMVNAMLKPAILKENQGNRKINLLPSMGIACTNNSSALFLVAMSTALIIVGIAASCALPDALHPAVYTSKGWLEAFNRDICINQGNVSMPYIFSYIDKALRKPRNDAVDLLTGIALVFLGGAFITLHWFRKDAKDHFKAMTLERTDRLVNSQTEAILSRLACMVNADEELLAQDIDVVFPYLSESELKLLNFSHLVQAKKMWPTLFDERLASSLYSKSQLAIWRLFDRLLKANTSLQKAMLSYPPFQDVIASDRDFFQMLAATLKPVDKRIQAIFRRLLKKNVLPPAYQIDKAGLKTIFQGLLAGKTLLNAMRGTCQELPSLPLGDFQTRGYLEIRSIQECYNYYIEALTMNDLTLLHWFEAYLSQYLDYLASTPDIVEQLANLPRKVMFLKIDTHLSQRDLPPFQSEEFNACYQFAIDFQLRQYILHLRSHYMAQIKAHHFCFSDARQLYKEIESLCLQIENLFPNHAELYLHTLRAKLISFLPEHADLLGSLAEVARANKHAWLLDLLAEAYFSDQMPYSYSWLSPFSKQDFLIS